MMHRQRAVRRAAAVALAAGGLAAAPASHAEDPGVTDFTRASASAIEASDISEALAVPRGTRLEATAPPTVRLPIYFEFNSTELQPDARELLEKVSVALASGELDKFRFSVEGHTDAIGSNNQNQNLSEARAEAVRSFLIARGVSEDRLGAVGRGESAPVDDNGTAEGRQRNRRVELINRGSGG